MTIPSVEASARRELVSLTEEHVTLLVREAVQVQRHCKRGRIHLPPETLAQSALHNQNSNGGILKRLLHADDINMALQWRGSEKIYATAMAMGGTSSSSSLSSTKSGHPQHKDVKKIMLEDYLKSEMELKPPQEISLTVHWLAVDGVQPEIPQNPVPASLLAAARRPKRVKIVHNVSDGEDGEEAEWSSSTTMVDRNTKPFVDPILSSAAGVNVGLDATAITDNGDVQVTQLLPRLLSEELRLYFSRITTAVERGAETAMMRERQDAALARLAQDAGLQELVPFLVHYVAQSLYKHMGNATFGRVLVRMARSLLVNPHLHLELYLHQLLPALLTMVVAQRLSSRSSDNHWVLRKEAAVTLVQACNLFGEDYATLKARVLRTLCDAIGPDKSLPTRYGGIVAITFFGAKAVHAFLLPLILGYWTKWQERLDLITNLEQRHELHMCQQAILDALGVFLSDGVDTLAAAAAAGDAEDDPEPLMLGWEDLEDTLGDQLVRLSNDETEYGLCFL